MFLNIPVDATTACLIKNLTVRIYRVDLCLAFSPFTHSIAIRRTRLQTASLDTCR
jgi:hypothetical protein